MSGAGICIKQNSIISDKNKRAALIAFFSLIINAVYAVFNIVLGLWDKSCWFITVGAYYLILAVLRFGVILSAKRYEKSSGSRFIRTFTGALLILMGIVLSVSVVMSVLYDVTKAMNEILVITMAAYSFTKITLAIINFTKRKLLSSPVLSLIRNIALADAAVSIFSLQRSMVVTFEGMTGSEITIMNAFTGGAVCILAVLIGVGIIYSDRKKIKTVK